ncbi:response regulator transcription factor [Dasania marina]|uniref:helix-turn-helix transcriptional regulator n=1 Tax=Dasania marina TaxID=471499 RepID=UPI0030D87114|tara:strand:- start:2438 stop:3058 length:621 start_codon:yes stop_codon:yes gene_type:complete
MNTPLFLTLSTSPRPNWLDAFADATTHLGPPKTFDFFAATVIYIDFSGLSAAQKEQWLSAAIAADKKVIVLSSLPSDDEAIDVIKQGAAGYGHALAVADQLREMCLVVKHGGLWVGSSLLNKVLAAVGRGASQAAAEDNSSVIASLSQREAMVAQAVARGATNQEISAHLGIAERTVKAHITSIFAKLSVRNRVELALLLNNVAFS